MKKKILNVIIEIHEEAIEAIAFLEKRLIELKVSHRTVFTTYGNVEITMELPYKTTIARGHERLIISLNLESDGNIKIPTHVIDSINIVTDVDIFG